MNSHDILRVAHHDLKRLGFGGQCTVFGGQLGVAGVLWVDAGEERDRPQLDA